jgi:hypothetical protein
VRSLTRRIAIELDDVLAQAVSETDQAGGTENFWETLSETEPNAVSRLAGIAADRRWEVIFLTRRPPSPGDIVQVQSQRWLEAKGFALPCVYVTPGSRGRIAAALHLDLVIDASPDNCVDVVTESDARAILVWPGDRSGLPADARRPEINIAKSFGECLDALSVVDDPSPRNGGVFAWVRRLFGLRQARQA